MFRNQIYVPRYYMCRHVRYSINVSFFITKRAGLSSKKGQRKSCPCGRHPREARKAPVANALGMGVF